MEIGLLSAEISDYEKQQGGKCTAQDLVSPVGTENVRCNTSSEYTARYCHVSFFFSARLG